MRKVLFVASVARHINAFHTPYLKWFKSQGFIVDAATSADENIQLSDHHYNISIERNPISKNNITAYRQLSKIISEGEYDIIHCHTPVAAMLTRLAARKIRKRGTKVFYTAHGFHFFKGANIINWLVYFPVEWISSFFTDVLITINKEDYYFAKKYMHAKKVEYVQGVGIDTDKIKNVSVDRKQKRGELGILPCETAVLSVGELNDNKNHETVIRAIGKLNYKNITYIICGTGEKDSYLKSLAEEYGVKLILMGFRNDVVEICKSCDIFVFPSKREGLPVSVMEAMAAGLPIVCSDVRGNVDLVKDGENGFLCKATDADEFAEKIRKLVDDKSLLLEMGIKGKETIQGFSLEKVIEKMYTIYGLTENNDAHKGDKNESTPFIAK